MEHKLSLPEKLFLLNINPEKGGSINGIGLSFEFSLIAAFLFELQSGGNIEIVNSRIKINSFKADDLVVAYILSKFQKFSRPLKINRWINRLHFSLNYIKREIKAGLAAKRIIRLEDRKFLFFKWKKSYLLDRILVRDMVIQIEKNIFSGEIQPDEKSLLSLIEPAGLLKRIFPDRQKRRSARQKLKMKKVDSQISIALKRAIAAARAAASS